MDRMNNMPKEVHSDKSKSLEDLFKGFDTDRYFEQNKNEYDWGKPQGKEIW